MSKSSIIKISLLIFLFLPLSSKAAELKFADKTWNVELATTNRVDVPQVRNDFDLKSVAANVLTGKPYVEKNNLLNPVTVEQLEKISSEINQTPLSAKLEIEDGWAKEFEPGRDGQAVDIYRLLKLLASGETKVELPVLISYAEKTLGDTNDLGIKELVAIGESDFTGSSRNRITNVTVGASRFDGLIVKPGETFSFNQHLGEVDAAHGFKPEIVIKREGLVPEYGGGLCQVSTTAFRAAMNGGFPVTERRNHSFAVRYYSPTGSDATIYDPVLDLKFVNDYSSHILVRTRVDEPNHKLYYEYYGTKDDRQVVLEGPFQYDKKPDGSVKAVWTKKVTKNGETVQQDFRSTYVSPSLYQKVATTPAAPTPTPTPSETVPAPDPVPAPQQPTPPPTT